jgi:HK97 gp10 family phage protein
MAEVLTWRIEGLEALNKRLKTLNDDIQKKIAFAAVSAAARVIQKQAKVNAKRLFTKQSLGSLVDNIAISRMRIGETGIGQYSYKIGVRGKKKSKKTGMNPWYWWFHELGTSKMQARPFIVPAMSSERKAALDAMERILRRRLEKAGV